MVKHNTPPAPSNDFTLPADLDAADGWALEIKPIVLGAACLVLVADPLAADRATLATEFVSPGELVCAFDDDEYDDEDDDDAEDDDFDDEDEEDDDDFDDEFEDDELDDDDDDEEDELEDEFDDED